MYKQYYTPERIRGILARDDLKPEVRAVFQSSLDYMEQVEPYLPRCHCGHPIAPDGFCYTCLGKEAS